MALLSLSMKPSLPQWTRLRYANGYPAISTLRCIAKAQLQDKQSHRRSANYKPNIWTHDFAESLKSDYMEERYAERAVKLKMEVKSLLEKEKNLLAQLELIDEVERLGLGYLFDKEIGQFLSSVTPMQFKDVGIEKSLHATALCFRLLRQKGHKVSQDVFRDFLSEDGDFHPLSCEDIKGMLSLYEASHFSIEGEHILDKGKTLTTMHLKNVIPSTNTDLYQPVTHALQFPLHWSMQRIEARWYIDSYKKRNNDMNLVLLELAKLDFNMVQSNHQKELKSLLRWWENLGLGNKLSFARDRVVESYLWSLGCTFEPEHEQCREVITKVIAIATVIDDIYDVYGTLDELELFTAVIERWDISAVEELPDYMKICFLATYNTVNEFGYHVLKEQGWNVIPYLKKHLTDLCKAYLVEAKWYHSGYIPKFKEYVNLASISIAGYVILYYSYFFLKSGITNEALSYLDSNPNLPRSSSMIVRLLDDFVTSKDELERGDVHKSIESYMHEYGVSEEVAREYVQDFTKKTWKKINEELATDSPLPRPVIDLSINFARTAELMYKKGDGHGVQDQENKDRVISLLVESID
ncbi:hypothetical protein Syun_027120 [Stephania yunnanensis]|uniref:Uncharacterized protein n=1 Tax=Stephania yunnanensis TaxID=152371 RepID=A0AAP0EFD3_9MAGN